jgi:hypothetical protein
MQNTVIFYFIFLKFLSLYVTGTRVWQHILVLASIILPRIDYAWRGQGQRGTLSENLLCHHSFPSV